jgi:hypothetical protein
MKSLFLLNAQILPRGFGNRHTGLEQGKGGAKRGRGKRRRPKNAALIGSTGQFIVASRGS